ncbi:4-coumarate--CoA ligase (photoactive yellow protein activation family) [Sphingomonas aurantiaca]|uniref:4-coumarate--CoA ligase (Photoactive yellow protein activation family) n=1 Tax=Sphingomonas aurantiaca TaxID=185949 RepID=A0A2T5GIW8_9SPHN|nr:AMP-binding protein [Sphingomonas aurantiaca]PTQ59264.1 4-coumarate--CoA ligase (photoactive yellow protein activation family) [Sphingomonas aurantiaca]
MTTALPALSRAAVHRIACAVVASELRRWRTTGAAPTDRDTWPEALPIGEDGLGLDSIEQLMALGALAETFGLEDSDLGREPPARVGDWIDWILRGHTAADGRMTVRTSGSTGRPKPCDHAIADLLDEAAFLATQIPGRRRVVALVPAHHLYGIIWTALLPAALGVEVVVRTIGTPFDLAPGDLVVAVPDQWRALLRLTRGFPADIVGVSSGGALDDRLAADLLADGLARLLDIYGSSETGGIALRDLPATAYTLLPRWHLLPKDKDWQLGDDRGLCHALPDHIKRIGDRGLRPTGRRDGAVQVGGHNVWPGRVAIMLRTLDGVVDAAVRLGDDGRLKAFIVRDDAADPDLLSARIDQAIADRLAGPERPKSIRFGAALPRDALGKLADWD